MKTPDNIIRLDAEKHNFAGYSVRKQVRGVRTVCYVSAAPSAHPGFKSPRTRYAIALEKALKIKALVVETLTAKKSWRDGTLTKTAQTKLEKAGVKVSIPKAKAAFQHQTATA